MEENKIYNRRYVARFTIEAATPIKVGTGKKGLTADEVVATDVNGLPYIPGTSLAGVLRSVYQGDDKDDIFGEDKGSRLIVSSANMIGANGKVIEGVVAQSVFTENNDFYQNYKTLALRDHVRIDHTGSTGASSRGKFDSQVVFKGTRFVFELELIGDGSENAHWEKLIEAIKYSEFRLGGGTRKGFGEIEVKSIEEKVYDLSKPDDLDYYLDKGISFNTCFGEITEFKKPTHCNGNASYHYQLTLKPEDFFIFSDGAGESNIDSVQKKEKIVKWNNKNGAWHPEFSEEQILIPATSVKGAIAHRTAFYYNQLNGIFSDEVDDLKEHVGQRNEAVRVLFGFEANDKNETGKAGHIGRVIFSDLFENKTSEKLLNHVAIDRFTGGAIDGALFNEQVVSSDEFTLNIYVEKALELETNKSIGIAFEMALIDVCSGMLPLGGSVMRGHGCFGGTILKDGITLKLEETK